MHFSFSAVLATAALLYSLPTHADPVDPSTTRLVVNLASYHINYVPTKKHPNMNQFNPGLGMEYELDNRWLFSGGAYRNSYYATSVYAGVSWLPLTLPISNGSLQSGVFTSIASGYQETNRGRAILPMAGLRFAWRPNSSPVGVDVLVMAREAKTTRAVLGFQLSYQLQ
jgi:hypothetical protein